MKSQLPTAHRHFNPSRWQNDLSLAKRFMINYHWQVLIATGLLVRIAGFLIARDFWFDEIMLFENIGQRRDETDPWSVWAQLRSEQVVPPGYLILLRLIHDFIGASVLALRFPTLIAGCLAFLWFAFFVKRMMQPQAALLATALFAFNADLVYYTQEMKPYAFDYLTTVLLLRLHFQCLGFPESVKLQKFWLLVFILIPWFSIASVFPVCAFWVVHLGLALRKKLTIPKRHLLIFLCWSVSFAISYMIEKKQVVPDSVLWKFWDFAFLKLNSPMHSAALLLDNLINPLHFLSALFASTQLMTIWGLIVTSVIIIGFCKIWKLSLPFTWFLLSTLMFMCVASLVRLYPFHGRTIVLIVPIMIIAFAEGFVYINERVQIPTIKFCMFMLIITPISSFLVNSPFYETRQVYYDGDLEVDFFTHKFGMMKRNPPE
jgi:uncharacterized membrane protein